MNRQRIPIYLLFSCIWLIAGCPAPQPDDRITDPSLRGIKMSDLQPSQSAPPSETQFIFSILTYELDNSSRDQLSMVFRWLSRRQIQYADKAAFDANGFTAAWAGHEKGTKVAQALAAIGAQRVRHGRLITSADMHETIWDEPIEAQTITFPISHRRTGRVSLGQGRLGWLLSPRFDPDQRQLAHIQLEPAFWTEGMSDLRALEGKIPYKYQTFQSGRFSLTLEPGDICVLAPSGSILQQQTLSRMLFEADEQRTRLFVIVLERAGN